jgi:tRNA (adenine22-N1)-methyltransferase
MRFIFIPATKHPFLRRWLAQHGFTLLDETPVLAAGRYYTVMHAAYTGGTKTPDPLWCVVGRAGRGPHAAGYLAREAMLLKKEARGAAPEESKRLLALAAAVEEAANTCQA